MSMPATPSSAAKITRGHSCILCRRRKVKCDGQYPCGNCTKARVQCTAPQIQPSRRRKRPQEDIAARLKRYEDIITKHGLKAEIEDEVNEGTDEVFGMTSGSHEPYSPLKEIQDTIGSAQSQTVEARTESGGSDGKMIVEKGQTRFVESSLWAAFNEDVREDSRHMLQSSSDDEVADPVSTGPEYGGLLFGRLMISDPLTSKHPPPVQTFRLWQTFIDNVNPLTKLLHVPTVQQMILEATGNLATVSTSTEALMFAIYHSAVVSMDEQDCQNILGESRNSALARYSLATQQALINAKVLKTSNLMVLQALALYLLSIRQFSDPDTLWALSGIAIRLGQRIGLHRDSASITSTLTILEVEIRHRLWWQIIILDNRSSQVSGAAASLDIHSYPRPCRPLNVNDSELSPSMREPPMEHTGITEMIFCSVRYEVGSFMMLVKEGDPVAVSSKGVDDLESRLEQKYLRYCDQSIPLHLLASLLARSAICRLRLMTHLPRRSHSSTVSSQTQTDRDKALDLSLKMIEYDNVAHEAATKGLLKGYMWHVNSFFQLEAFIQVLSELRLRTTGDLVEWAWKQVEQCYQHHPEMLADSKNALWVAIGNLSVKAWERRVQAVGGQYQLATPGFVLKLYERRIGKGVTTEERNRILDQRANNQNQTDLQLPQDGHDMTNMWMGSAPNFSPTQGYVPMDNVPLDWEYWQAFFDNVEVQLDP